MSKKILKLVLSVIFISVYTVCSTGIADEKVVASDGVEVQTGDPDMPSRVVTGGVRIIMHFGDTVIPGILNNSKAARSLIAMLPYTVSMSRYSHDFCGVMSDALEYAETNVRYGWLNGDIVFSRDANYFTVLFADQENSEKYGNLVNIGVITCELSKISKLQGNYDVLIELAD